MSTKNALKKTLFIVITIVMLTACGPQASNKGLSAPVAATTQAQSIALTSSPIPSTFTPEPTNTTAPTQAPSISLTSSPIPNTIALGPTGTTTPVNLVGRWQQLHTCDNFVRALNQAGLGAIVSNAVSNSDFFFSGESAQQLAQKKDICSGASAISHFHFFSSTGEFGSLDENESQVDSGNYVIIDKNTLQISNSDFSNATFNYTVTQTDTLQLEPVLTQAEIQQALANPDQFTQAIWMITVAFPGTTWTRVVCGKWC